MIKVDEKGIEVNGDMVEIMTNLSRISEALKENGIPDELITFAINLGLTKDDKRDEYTEEAAKEIATKMITDILKKKKEESY